MNNYCSSARMAEPSATVMVIQSGHLNPLHFGNLLND
jgi:hypothetical protein